MDSKESEFLAALKEEIVAFESVLETAATEEDLQIFLADHPSLLSGGIYPDFFHVIPKLKLGSEYVTDFAACTCRQTGFHWKLIEIERPDLKLFNKRGDPTKELTHAIGQVQQWRRWINDNSEYCRSNFVRHIRKEHFRVTMTIGRAPKAWHRLDDIATKVIIGRKATLTPDNLDRLYQINVDMRGAVEVMTFDRLLDQARENLESFGKLGKLTKFLV